MQDDSIFEFCHIKLIQSVRGIVNIIYRAINLVKLLIQTSKTSTKLTKKYYSVNGFFISFYLMRTLFFTVINY